jgi:PhnB protein
MPDVPVGLVPHLVVSDGAAAIEFYKKAFGAQETMRMPAEDGKRLMHAQMRIGESTLFLADDFPEFCGGKPRNPNALGGTPVTIHQYVRDVDASIKRAADAGATVNMPAADMFWGDRYGQVIDPFGHNWSFATPLAQTKK